MPQRLDAALGTSDLELRVDPPVPPARHDLPHLDAVRGLAALAIVVHHAASFSGGSTGMLGGWYQTLDVGVTLFFALSGFLLFRGWVMASTGRKGPVRTGPYLWRRAVRIYPALLVMMAAVWVFRPSARETGAWTWIATLGLQQNWRSTLFEQVPELVHVWSLATEFGFYLLLPLLATVVLRSRRVGLALTVLAGVGIVWTFGVRVAMAHGHAEETLTWTPAFFDWFGVGMALAWLRERTGGAPAALVWLARRWWFCWAVAFAVYAALTPTFWFMDLSGTDAFALPFARHVLYGVIAALVLLPLTLADRPAAWTPVAGSFPLRWLGRLSYGVFLWHMPLIHWLPGELSRRGYGPSTPLSVAVVLPVTLVLAYATWRWIERPLMARARTPREALGLIPRPRRTPARG